MASRILLCEALREWIAGQRWFGGKQRRIRAVAIEDGVALGGGTLWLARVELDDGRVDRYAVPLLDGPGVVDALDDPGFCRAQLELIAREERARGARGEVVAARTRAFPAAIAAEGRRLAGEQSNTSVVFGDALILKHFRRLAPGINPDIEITRFLTERTDFRHTPRLCGSLEYRDEAGGWALAMAQELVREARDGWRWLLERLAGGDEALGALDRLGRRTAELHRALASDPRDPAFAPEPVTAADVHGWTDAVQRQLDAARAALGGAPPAGVPARIDATGLGSLVGAVKQRHHGDFHLGQTLVTGENADFALIDFEGEPLRPLDERRRKHTPLRDVAGLLRSLGYAAASVPAPEGWEERARRAFLEGYREAAGSAAFLPRDPADFTRAVAVLEVEKAAYEVVYEAGNRPAWLPIPVRGVIRAARTVAGRG
ncbi:MAG TPA: sugar phosphotransferase [Methylomirabilota bacterium]|nr:sugar phosphotransferase [Methylomirabilota bacterium]